MFGSKQKWLRFSKWTCGIGMVLFVVMLVVCLAGIFRGQEAVPAWNLVGMMIGAVLILANVTILGILELKEEIAAKPKRALLILLAEFAGLFFIYLLVIVAFRGEEFSWGQSLSWCLIIILVDKTLAFYQRYRIEKKGK